MRDDILLLFFHAAALLSLSSLDSVDRDEASVKIMSISEKYKKVYHTYQVSRPEVGTEDCGMQGFRIRAQS
jgi:hypothetical protein